jgi:hypothetical protein
MNDESKTCYETAEQNPFTRIETGRQGVFLFPGSALLFAHEAPRPAGASLDTLTLLYVTHTVTIRGTRLLPLLLVIQKGRAEVIRVGGGQSQSNGTQTTPAVREITVAEGCQKSE